MPPVLSALLVWFGSLSRSRLALRLQILALQHQVGVYKRTVHRPRESPTDRIFWAWLSHLWTGWREVLTLTRTTPQKPGLQVEDWST